MAEKGKIVTSPVPVQSVSSGTGSGKVGWIKQHKYIAAAGAGGIVIGGYLLYEHFHDSSSSSTTVPTSSSSGSSGSSGSGISGSSGTSGSSGSGGYSSGGGYGGSGTGSGLNALSTDIGTGFQNLQNSLDAQNTANQAANQSLFSQLQSQFSSALGSLSQAISGLSNQTPATSNPTPAFQPASTGKTVVKNKPVVTTVHGSGGVTHGVPVSDLQSTGSANTLSSAVYTTAANAAQASQSLNPAPHKATPATPQYKLPPSPTKVRPQPKNTNQANQWAAAGWRG